MRRIWRTLNQLQQMKQLWNLVKLNDDEEDFVVGCDEDTVVNKLVVSVLIEAEENILDVCNCGVLKAVDEEHMAVQSVELSWSREL